MWSSEQVHWPCMNSRAYNLRHQLQQKYRNWLPIVFIDGDVSGWYTPIPHRAQNSGASLSSRRGLSQHGQ